MAPAPGWGFVMVWTIQNWFHSEGTDRPGMVGWKKFSIYLHIRKGYGVNFWSNFHPDQTEPNIALLRFIVQQ